MQIIGQIAEAISAKHLLVLIWGVKVLKALSLLADVHGISLCPVYTE